MSRYRVVSTGAVCLGLAVCFGVAGSASASSSTSARHASSASAAGTVKIKFLAQITPTLNKKFWQKEVNRFTARNKGISVQIIAPPNTDQAAYLRQLLASGDLPDVGFAVGTAPQIAPLLQPWDTKDPQIKEINNIKAMEVHGKLLDLGVDVQPRNTVYYNTALLAKAGITSVPTTLSQFTAALSALKASGIAPLCGAGEWVTGRMLMGFNHIFNDTTNWYQLRATNKVKFDSPSWLSMATRFQQWAQAGYFSPGALGTSYVSANDNFRTGGCAIYQMGIWYNGDLQASPASFKVAIGAFPTAGGKVELTGGIGTADYVVFKKTKHPAEADALARFLAFDPIDHQNLIEVNGTLSNLSIASKIKWNFTPLELQTQTMVSHAAKFNPDYIGQGDEVPVDGIIDAINVSAQALLSGSDPKTQLDSLDALWDRNSKTS